MGAILKQFQQAELALAAYADLAQDVPEASKLLDAGLTPLQAINFQTQYRVIETYSDAATGFSVSANSLLLARLFLLSKK